MILEAFPTTAYLLTSLTVNIDDAILNDLVDDAIYDFVDVAF